VDRTAWKGKTRICKDKEMRMNRCRSYVLVLGAIVLGFLGIAQAQEKYPNRPIELVVPFAPGGTGDLTARSYSDELARTLKVPVTIVNHAGGSGIQGTKYAISGKKDGYRLLASTGTPLVLVPVISKEATYDPLKDVIPIGYFGYSPLIFAVKSDSPFKTLAALVDYARKNPGKVKSAITGFGTEGDFNMQLLCHKEQIKITPIPFKSGGESLVALLGGHMDMATSSITSLGQQIKSGTIRALAICSKSRHPDFPNIPTTAELGCPDASLATWTGFFAPTGVPRQVVDVLVPAVQKVFNNPEVIQRGTQAGIVVEYMGPEDLRKLMESGIQLVRKVAQDADMVNK
jgi:tripartite-type tricarboxylate transporter receptor subunit TctC